MVEDIRLSELTDTIKAYREARRVKDVFDHWLAKDEFSEFAQSARNIYEIERARKTGPKGIALFEEQFPAYKTLFSHLRAQYMRPNDAGQALRRTCADADYNSDS